MSTTSFFANSHGFMIEGSNFASVNGDQIVNHYHAQQEKERTEYDEFRQIICGDIYRTKDFGAYRYPRCYDDREWWGKGVRADRTICAAQVVGVQGRVFTVVSYTGPDAREAFEKDFQMFSRTLTANSFQVYGINTHIPTVLFHDELRPAASFLDKVGLFGRLYLNSLKMQFNCQETELWLDPKKGVLCRGPVGPDTHGLFSFHSIPENLPCSSELLQDDDFLHFLADFKSKRVDQIVATLILECWYDGNSEVKFHQPTIFSTVKNATVAVSGQVWRKVWRDNCLGVREVMENGATRFTLMDLGSWLCLETDLRGSCRGWLLQASSIFHVCGVSLGDDLDQYEFIGPNLELDGRLVFSEILCLRRRQRTIYLFVLPLSTPSEDCTTASLHYWSFDPTGKDPLSAETCHHLGLPIELTLTVNPLVREYWTNESYRTIHQYQLTRGFDPTTSDFARFCGYPLYRAQNDSNRFENLDAVPKSLWSNWTWEASEGSDIPAFGL